MRQPPEKHEKCTEEGKVFLLLSDKNFTLYDFFCGLVFTRIVISERFFYGMKGITRFYRVSLEALIFICGSLPVLYAEVEHFSKLRIDFTEKRRVKLMIGDCFDGKIILIKCNFLRWKIYKHAWIYELLHRKPPKQVEWKWLRAKIDYD